MTVSGTVVSSTEYNRLKRLFFEKHKNDFVCDTSPMDGYGIYYKTYTFSDNASWYERMSPEFVESSVTAKGITIPVTVKMFKVEFWNSDVGFSKYYYELFDHTLLNRKIVI